MNVLEWIKRIFTPLPDEPFLDCLTPYLDDEGPDDDTDPDSSEDS